MCSSEILLSAIYYKSTVFYSNSSYMFLCILLPVPYSLLPDILCKKCDFSCHAIPGRPQGIRYTMSIRSIWILHGIIHFYLNGMYSSGQSATIQSVCSTHRTIFSSLHPINRYLRSPMRYFYIQIPCITIFFLNLYLSFIKDFSKKMPGWL
ncbi:unknown [Roseburia sp. CAG:100]|nr:unknown [Roseburia sp. CAG:100]